MEKSKQFRKQDEWQLRQFIQIIKRRWKIIATAITIGVLFSITFHIFCPRKYESKAQMLVMRKDPRLAARGVDATQDAEVRVTEELLATHMQMIQSRTLVDSALKENDLYGLPSIVDHVTEPKKPCDYIIDNMVVTRGGTGQARTAHVLSIALRNSSPEEAQTILQAIIKKYQSFLSEKFQDVNQEAASLITRAEKELANDLEESEHDYEQFRQASSNLMWKSGTETTNIHRVRYEGILQELATLQLSRAEAEARLDAVNERLDGKDATELSDLEKLSLVDEKNLTRVGLLLIAQRGETEAPDFQAEQPIRAAQAKAEFDTYSALQLKEKALMTDLGEKHPEVVNVRKQIQSIREFIGKQKEDLTTGRSALTLDPKALFEAFHNLLQNDILAMTRREERLNRLAEESLHLASDMVTDEIQGEALRREVQRKQALFDAAVDRLRDINLAKDYGGFINEVLSEPELGQKVMPKLSLSLALGMVFSMAIAVGGIGVTEYRDRRFRTIDDISALLQAPVIGRIPLVSLASMKSGALAAKKTSDDQPNASRILDPNSRAADAFRHVRTSLMFSDGEERRQVLCVTSPNPADGKSTMTANLAISLGQLGRSVLVIDCDLRRPSQHGLFDVPNDRGLTNLLKNQLDPNDLILPTPHKNVFLIPRGESVQNPAEFLATGEFSQMLDALREKFDHILLDCPPVLPIVDALTPAAIADGVILVIRVERTTQLQAQVACASLRNVGAELAGTVINGLIPGSVTEDTYGYGYGYDYKYSGYSEYAENKTETASNTEMPTNIKGTSRSRLRAANSRNGSVNREVHQD